MSSLPKVTPMEREAHRLMLAQGQAQKDVRHVGSLAWPPGSQAKIPLRVPPLLHSQELKSPLVQQKQLQRRLK